MNTIKINVFSCSSLRTNINFFQKNNIAESRCLGSLHFELHAGLAEKGRRTAQERNGNFRGALEESLKNAEECVRLLQREPTILSEGQICAQAKLNVESLRVLLATMSPAEL